MSSGEAAIALAFIGLVIGFVSCVMHVESKSPWVRRLAIIAFIFTLPALSKLWVAVIFN